MLNIHNNNFHHRIYIVHYYNMVIVLNKYVFVDNFLQDNFLDIDIYNHQDNSNMFHYLNKYLFDLFHIHLYHIDIQFHTNVYYINILLVHWQIVDMYYYFDNLILNINHFHTIHHYNHHDIDIHFQDYQHINEYFLIYMYHYFDMNVIDQNMYH